MTPPTRIAILDDYQQVAFQFANWSTILESASIDVYTNTLLDEDALVDRLEPYSIVCAMRERTKFSAAVLDRLPNLKFIATTGMRNASIDIQHARLKGILVSGTGSKDATSEHVWALILASTRHIAAEDANIKALNPQWQSTIPLHLSTRTLGILGLGRLGQRTAEIAKVFGMNVIAWSPNLTEERAANAGVGFARSKEQLFRTSDVLSVHMVLSERTRHLIALHDLQSMKKTAFFINTSRGPIVDEEALVEVLKKGGIAGAGLDVFSVEPLPLDHPLRQLNNVTISPHTGYVSDLTYEQFWSETVENIGAFLSGHPTRVLNN